MNLIKYLPQFYKNTPEVVNLMNSFNTVNDEFKTAIKDLENQIFIDKATWALDLWDIYVGINTKEFIVEERREKIKARLQGKGVITNQIIKEIVEEYGHGIAEVIEFPEDYTFKIKFISRKGYPTYNDYLKQDVEYWKPAHFKTIYEYLWNKWGEVNTYTWRELNSKKRTWYWLASHELLYKSTYENLEKMLNIDLEPYLHKELQEERNE